MTKAKTISPEDLFNDALSEDLLRFTNGDLRLLVSGLSALRAAGEKPLNAIELNAVKGMIAYVAYTQEVSEETVLSVLMATYNVDDVSKIPSRLYQDIIEYLVDLQMDKIVN